MKRLGFSSVRFSLDEHQAIIMIKSPTGSKDEKQTFKAENTLPTIACD